MKRAMVALIVVVVLLLGTVAVVSATEAELYILADKVLVNKSGGITVEGSCDCTQAVVDRYGQDPAAHPDMVLLAVNWDAYQYVGRTKVVSAQYRAGIATPCYVKGQAGPYRWQTRFPFPIGDIQWVYSPNGKFAAGPIHVEVFSDGSLADDVMLYGMSQADLRAVRPR